MKKIFRRKLCAQTHSIKVRAQSGFTLFEIVTAVAILAMLSVSFMSIMIATRNHANRELSTSHAEQALSEAKVKIITEISDANIGIAYWDNSDGSLADGHCKVLATYKLGDVRNKVNKTYIKYDCNTGNIYVATSSGGYNATTGVHENLSDVLSLPNEKWKKLIGDWETFVDRVESFDVSVYNDVGITNLLLCIEYDGQSYSSQRSIYTKNKLRSNELIQAQ